MPFAYLKDPLFLACFAAYWAHRCLAAYGIGTAFLRGYLNDLICIPFWVPIMLLVQKRLRLRKHDGVPEAVEVVIPLVIIAALFEVVIPTQGIYQVQTTPDPYDVLAYSVGALVAVLFWRWHYRAECQA